LLHSSWPFVYQVQTLAGKEDRDIYIYIQRHKRVSIEEEAGDIQHLETQLNVNPHRSLKREKKKEKKRGRPIVYRGPVSATLSADMVSIPPDYKYRSASARGPRAKPQSFIIPLPFTLALSIYWPPRFEPGMREKRYRNEGGKGKMSCCVFT
jgi:hypothetical protein